VDALFASQAEGKLPGAAVVVLRDGTLVHSKAYGLARLDTAAPNTTRTRLRLASVSKSFTALMVLKLVEQGRLRLEDTLEPYVPGVNGGDKITIAHLLSHTAGMPDFMGFEQAAKLPRDGAPGERLNYSNLGYSALGRVIEKASGKSYEAFLHEAILDPLGMKDTGLDRKAAALDEGRAAGYLAGKDGAYEPAEFSDTERDPASGGLFSTAEDMATWARALSAGRIVSPRLVERAWTPVTLNDGRQGRYGYGFMLNPYRGLREAGHGGDISGFNSYVAFYPSEKLAVVVLSNAGMRPPGPLPDAGTLAHRIVDLVVGERLGPAAPPAVSLPEAVLDRYAGRYRVEAPPPVLAVMGDAIEIRREGARLLARGKQGEAELVAESEREFRAQQGPVRITFPAAAGAAPGAVLTLAGVRELSLVREP
jgi:CubicO group peptidase (beta-lactamase class C family)